MEKNVRDFLINMVATSFSDIGYALRILLGDGNTTENEALIRKAESADDRIQFLKALADKASEEKENTTIVDNPNSEAREEKTEEKPRAKRKAAKADKPAEAPHQEAETVTAETPRAEKAVTPAEPTTEVAAVTTAEVPSAEVKTEESQKPKEEPKHKTTLPEVRKMMTDISRRGKGAVVQKVLADFKVTKLSDVNEDDYDDFITRVLYFADELEEKDA